MVLIYYVSNNQSNTFICFILLCDTFGTISIVNKYFGLWSFIEFKDFSNSLSNHDNKYDVVYGPIANDDLATSFAIYTRKLIDIKELKERLKFKKLTNQYSFHTKKAIEILDLLESKTYEKN